MIRLSQIRKGVMPAPVYEAHFADGRVQRMSFWSKRGKPFDFDGGRDTCFMARQVRMLPIPTRHRVVAACLNGVPLPSSCPPVVDGYVEHDEPGKPWVRVRDPLFDPDAIAAVPKRRITTLQARKALTDVLAYLDGKPVDASVIERARELAA